MSEWAKGIAWSKDLETENDAIDSQHIKQEDFKIAGHIRKTAGN